MPGTIRIAGAGLAGLTAATLLARSGRAVEVYEKKSKLLPSSGPHTEGIRNYGRIDALQELRAVGFDIEPFGVVRRTIRFSANFRNVLHGPAYYLFMRGHEGHTVDQILYQRAKEEGVEFHFGQRLDPSEADIVATGPPKDRFNILGAGYTFTEEGSHIELDVVHAIDTAVRGGSLYVGEAGGFQDAIAGFGFRYAVLTAALAARANVEGHDYRELLKAKFGDEFRKAYDFREWLNRATNADFDKLIAAMGSEVTLVDYLRQRGSRAI